MTSLFHVKRWMLAYLAVGLATACATTREPTHPFVGFIAGLDRAEPIYPEALSRLIGQNSHCTNPGPSNGRIDFDNHDLELFGMQVGKLDFRSTPGHGSILILGPLAGDCISVDDFDAAFGKGSLMQGCSDGVICIYRVYRRSWGRLSLDPGGSPPAKSCVRAVVLDSYPG